MPRRRKVLEFCLKSNRKSLEDGDMFGGHCSSYHRGNNQVAEDLRAMRMGMSPLDLGAWRLLVALMRGFCRVLGAEAPLM